MNAGRLLIVLTVLMLAGCAADARRDPARVSMDTSATTRPSDGSVSPPRGPAGRRVELTVRDSTAAGLAGSVLGHTARVQFRRDALGIASNSAMGPTQDWNGRLSIEGKVTAMTDQWLVVAGPGKRFCVPIADILVVEVQD